MMAESGKRHVDDVLQNSPSLKPVESGTPPVDAVTSATSAEVVTHSQSAMPASASTPPQDELGTKDTPPLLRRSLRTSTPPQRLIEQIWSWTLLLNNVIVAIHWLFT